MYKSEFCFTNDLISLIFAYTLYVALSETCIIEKRIFMTFSCNPHRGQISNQIISIKKIAWKIEKLRFRSLDNRKMCNYLKNVCSNYFSMCHGLSLLQAISFQIPYYCKLIYPLCGLMSGLPLLFSNKMGYIWNILISSNEPRQILIAKI